MHSHRVFEFRLNDSTGLLSSLAGQQRYLLVAGGGGDVLARDMLAASAGSWELPHGSSDGCCSCTGNDSKNRSGAGRRLPLLPLRTPLGMLGLVGLI